MIPFSGDILLGPAGQEQLLTRFGRKFSEGEIEFAKSERTASARLVKDIIAIKKKFRIEYSEIDGDDLRAVLILYNLQTELSLIVHYEYVSATYVVRMSPFDRSRVISLGQGLWSNVTIEMEEV
jgi:hypothetical protein